MMMTIMIYDDDDDGSDYDDGSDDDDDVFMSSTSQEVSLPLSVLPLLKFASRHGREKAKISAVFVTCVVFNIPCVANFPSVMLTIIIILMIMIQMTEIILMVILALPSIIMSQLQMLSITSNSVPIATMSLPSPTIATTTQRWERGMSLKEKEGEELGGY